MILDLYRHPLNKEKLAKFDVQHKEHNPLCGDTVEVYIEFAKNGTVKNISWDGEGCAISQASTSLVTDFVKNKSKTAILKIGQKEVLEMLGLKNLNPARLRCAMLGLESIRKCLKNI
jgi:nitrogen fixation NifU-like protein